MLRSRSALCATFALAMLPGCSAPGDGDAGADGGQCAPLGVRAVAPACTASACECAERGTPVYCHENEGRSSADSDETQRASLARANRWRTSAGISALHASEEIEQAALAHAHFMATTSRESCWPGVHNEIEAGCAGFTGTTMGDRMTAAGYRWSRASEVINWESNPAESIDGWIWTVYHRQPFMDWRYQDVGFARENGPLGSRMAFHNVMNFGAPRTSTAQPPAEPAVFPVPGQTDVPRAFRGDLEGPTPPAPGGGGPWPRGTESGTVVSVHFPSAMWTVDAHRIFSSAGGMCQELPSTYVSRHDDPNLNRGTPANDVFLYANEPLAAGTEHVVQFEGTFNGGPWRRTWAFTTR